ncbi:MAG: alkaline phosphatase PhoX, partial [Bacteroidota bacterium]
MTLFGSGLIGQVQSLQVQVNSSTDDAEERGANAGSNPGLMDLSSTDLELVLDGNDGDQYVGIRFTGVTIPQGAVILNAYIQFTVDEDDDSTGTVIWRVEDVDNSSTFGASSFDISSRALMPDSVVWSNIPVWPNVGVAGPDQQTPDLSILVQSIVNRPAWQSGNALNFIAYGTGERVAESYDGSASSAPILVVEYIVPVVATFPVLTGNDDAEMDVANGAMDLGSSDLELTTDGSSLQLIAMRFDNVNIPSGSVIQDAYIQFTVDEVNTTGNVDVYISMEDADNSAPITNTAGELGNRNYLDSVIWNALPGWNAVGDAGSAQQTPNIAGLLQQIIDRGGWASGNAVMAAMIDPFVLSVPGYSGNAAKRVAQSYDRDPAAAAKLVVSYIPPAVYQVGTFPISAGGSWKYDDSGTPLDTANWTDVAYNASSWAFGNAILGYGNGNEITTLDFGSDPGAKHPTYYLRNTFIVPDASVYDSLVFNLLRDDGAIVYVNGIEAFRSNMPGGTVDYNTLALAAVGGSNETTYFQTKTANLLQNGANVIAVELHQASAGSSDLSFDLGVGFELPPLSAASYPFPQGSDWHYLDDGSSLDAIAWKDTLFNDDNWEQGPGPLGYGDPMNTTISFGPDPNNKYITYYFRRDINIDLSAVGDSVLLGLRRDDGAVVYINGVEVVRDNMPAGTITSTTLAPSTVAGGNETTYFSFFLDKNVFRDGRNQIAVEVHNRDVFSSDLGFDLFIEDAPVANPPALGCEDGNDGHIACFTSIAPTSQTSNMLLPTSSHRFQMIFKQGDAYTIGGGTVPGNHDFTGFVGLNGSSEVGHLSVNHENTPGGVSMIDLHYVDSTLLWVIDTTRAVDFYNNDLVTTTRNCSGGITPWGTIITAEETSNSADVNADGYTDVGWLVEIDPITAKVKEYGNGIQEKLWAAGRVSHENAVVLNDSITLYTGEDGGSSAVFKFIADTPGDLSSGALYVLKLDSTLVGGEPTVSTGTWLSVPNTTQTERSTTRSLAIGLGATNFSGVEDIEVSPLDGKMYFTSKGLGRIFRFSDNGNTVSDFETFVGGTSYVLNTEQGVFIEPWGGGNDNLTFDDLGNLWVLQDGGNDYVWVVTPDHTQADPKVELFMSGPIGSEPTGLTFSPDYRFGFISIQHPSSANTPQQDATG